MKIPTINQFNNWSKKDQEFWINFETDGSYRVMKKSDGYFPLLIYPNENVAVVYRVDGKGELVEATAMTIKEAYDRLEQARIASKGVSSYN